MPSFFYCIFARIPLGFSHLEGVIAQLGERYNGIVEVGGSIPPGSTKDTEKKVPKQTKRRGNLWMIFTRPQRRS